MGSSDQLLSDRRNGARFRKRHELFKEDVAHMKELGLKGYRFSIDWSRVLPDGFGTFMLISRHRRGSGRILRTGPENLSAETGMICENFKRIVYE